MSDPQPARAAKDKYRPFGARDDRVWDVLEKRSKLNSRMHSALRNLMR